LVGIAKYLYRPQTAASRTQLLRKLNLSDRALQLGIQALQAIGFQVVSTDAGLQIPNQESNETDMMLAIAPFLSALREEQFRRQYFAQLSIDTIRTAAQTILLSTQQSALDL
jgi:single-stranded-DNA-specific exonuclease